MTFEKNLIINHDRAKTINHLLNTEPKSESECFNEDEKESDEIVFDNGIRFVVELCGVQYEDNNSNTPWTQALLYDTNGSELTFTEPDCEYLGTWELEYNNDTYIVNVLDHNPANQVKAIIRFVTCTTAEAITELNIQLDAAGLPHISENDLIDSQKTDHDEDWFDDYTFTFEKIFDGNPENIIETLNTHMDDVEFDL